MTKSRDLANASTALSAVSPTELGYLDGVECVSVENADGTTWSGLKSAYDEMQAEQSTPSV